MPYIKADDGRREALRNGEPALTAGELNYQIFYLIKHCAYIDWILILKYVNNFLEDKPNYQKYNDMTGVLIRCEKEIKRRLNREVDLQMIMEKYDDEIAKYEDKKIIENGDVE